MWAHSANDAGVRHRLEDHLRAVAELARSFAAPFGLGDLASWTGLVHDGGKAWCDWQQKLIQVEAEKKRVGKDHKSFGVQLAQQHGLEPVEFAVAGHHGGLTNRLKIKELFGTPAQEAQLRAGPWADAERRLRRAVPEMFSQVPALPADFGPEADPLTSEFLLRFLFSCLVDADVLDTQAHFGSSAPRLGTDLDAQVLLDRFLDRRLEYLKGRGSGPMQPYREQVFEAALRAAESGPGLFRLTAPTGTAKTIGAAAFALRHAAIHDKRRVIVAVPFITITEQNAEVYRKLLDPDDPLAERVVLEHHSQVELEQPDKSDRHSWHRLAAENWSAPFIVTTTVQLFESLFGRTGSATRKLHRIANSVIILDEVQALPHRLLHQVADALRILTERFGVTVVLSSATQPELTGLTPLRDLCAQEIVPDPAGLFAECQRVTFDWRLTPKPTIAEVVADAVSHHRALLVMNTVRDARTAFLAGKDLVSDGKLIRHLSTGMCPAHRHRVLDEVKDLLQREQPILLVSTSLVEAGVDLDFPTVFRAVGPPESMAQVAGRCNRERRLGPKAGQVVIFDPADGGFPPSYPTQIDMALKCFGPDKAGPEDPEALSRYFPKLYKSLRIESGKVNKAIDENRRRWDFRAVADGPLRMTGGTDRDRQLAFRLIVEDTIPVLVHYDDPKAKLTISDCLSSLRSSQPDMSALRSLQPYITTLRRRTADKPDVRARLQPVIGDLHEWQGDYDDEYGIVLDIPADDYFW